LHGERLSGIAVDDLPRRWPPIDGTVAVNKTDCPDDGEASTSSMSVSRLRGVPPAVAVANGSRARVDVLYLADGYLLQLPEHPLHIGRYGSPSLPDERHGQRCRPQSRLAGRVIYLSEWEGRLEVRRAGRADVPVRVDARTTVIGERGAGGLPRIRVSDRVTVRGVRCGRHLVARQIRRDG
jgi:hypothetical protein